MCLTCGLFACLDTTAKYLGTVTNLPILELVWMRFLGQLAAIVVMLGLLAVPDLLRTRKLGLQIVRSFLLLGSTAFNFLALRHLRLDQTTTISFLAPLATAVLAGPLLGEWIGWRRGFAIVIGFIGALIAIRPASETCTPTWLGPSAPCCAWRSSAS
jgi:drug/metabolite transporter (DMT)-like permease